MKEVNIGTGEEEKKWGRSLKLQKREERVDF